jgi:putative endonuclease
MGAIMTAGAFLYILRCADGKYYVGTTRRSLEERLSEHNAGVHKGFTATRRPVTLVFAQHFDTITDAIEAERQVKGWSRAKKEAMIKGSHDQRRVESAAGIGAAADSPCSTGRRVDQNSGRRARGHVARPHRASHPSRRALGALLRMRHGNAASALW